MAFSFNKGPTFTKVSWFVKLLLPICYSSRLRLHVGPYIAFHNKVLRQLKGFILLMVKSRASRNDKATIELLIAQVVATCRCGNIGLAIYSRVLVVTSYSRVNTTST